MKTLRTGVIGATGMVGQQFITLLDSHPWFNVVCLAASSRSAGNKYGQAVGGRWKLATPRPAYADDLQVYDADADFEAIAQAVDIIFCAVDMEKSAIRELEERYANAGVAVISNNSAHRSTPDVPMLIPEVNPGHTGLIDIQRQNRGWDSGLIAVKPNCSIQSYTLILEALKAFEPAQVHVTSLQALSGAGQTLASWPEMVDNVNPLIEGEEEKSEHEPLQIWGKLTDTGIKAALAPSISATCIRVPVSDGHLADVSVHFKNKPNREDLLGALKSFGNPLSELNLPSSPKQVIRYLDGPDRPQTKLDRGFALGMGISMGRLRKLPEENPYHWRFVSLAHNTIRGAAGGAILMAELLTAKEYIKSRQ